MFYRSMAVNTRTDRLRRARPVLVLAAVAFVVGAIVGASHGADASDALASRFVGSWARGEYLAMYGDIDGASKRRMTPQELASACAHALATATATGLAVTGKAHDVPGGLVNVPVRVRTRLFGTLRLAFVLRVAGAGNGEAGGIVWSRSAEFPGLKPGQKLARRTTLPPRATLLARDGSVLGEGVAETAGQRDSPLGGSAGAALGEVGSIPESRAARFEAEGIPSDAIVGVSGAEEALDERLRGRPGGELLAESERPGGPSSVLAVATPRPAHSVRTTISPAVQRAAVAALGGQLGGVVAMAPSTGQILAVAGLGIDDLQPPGSTFKMVTTSGVLQAGIAKPSTVFPYATYATLDGVKLSNANGEECGGSLELAFAVSCNSVFSPLGVKLGAPQLVAMAEAYGFNHGPGIPGAVESTLPAASRIKGELDLGSTAIGQGQVQASPLQMATVAATIADHGHRPQPTFALDASPHTVATATSASVADTLRRFMIAVVREGTGSAAAIPGVTVAGKTGTAELGTPGACSGSSEEGGSKEGGSGESRSSGCGAAAEAANTDAWFAAFAPALHPKIVVCVLMVKDGAGGDTAAPVARAVIEAGLHAGL
ncbi:MAG TPA: penicillin-binding transpeptidase domain-containing protein [Solirubrobacteraceae bacterium]|nr:penicillin-binding transpeptidase domain-containing protein [Solirubrobacteraceae bacterium]